MPDTKNIVCNLHSNDTKIALLSSEHNLVSNSHLFTLYTYKIKFVVDSRTINIYKATISYSHRVCRYPLHFLSSFLGPRDPKRPQVSPPLLSSSNDTFSLMCTLRYFMRSIERRSRIALCYIGAKVASTNAHSLSLLFPKVVPLIM